MSADNLLREWCLQRGRNLCPTAGSADTFGDGMREAKRQVSAILDRCAADPAPEPGSGTWVAHTVKVSEAKGYVQYQDLPGEVGNPAPESAVGDEIAAAVDNLIGVVHAHHIPEKFKYFHCTTMTEVKAQTDHVLALIAKAIAAAKVKLDATVREQIRLLTDDNVALRKERDAARAEVKRFKERERMTKERDEAFAELAKFRAFCTMLGDETWALGRPSGVEVMTWFRAVIQERDAARAEVERLKAGGCARDQRTTQFCAEAVALQRENERLRAELAAKGGDHGK